MPPKKSSSLQLYATPILASLSGKRKAPPPPPEKAPTKKELADAKRLKKAQEIIEKENLKAGVSFVAGTSPAIPVDPKEKFVKPKPMKGKISPKPKQVTDEEINKAVAEATAATTETTTEETVSVHAPESSGEEEESSEEEQEEEDAPKESNGHSNGHQQTLPETPLINEKTKKKTTPQAPKKPKTKKEEFPPWLPTFFSTVLKEAYQSTDQKVSKRKIQEQAKEESSRTWADPVRKERAQAVADDHVNKMYKSIFG